MSVGINLQLRQSQSLVMTPQLQQAIKLLQMSNLDLADYVTHELEQNPLLEVIPALPDERRGSDGGPSEERETPPTAADDLGTQLQHDNLSRAEETFDTGLENVYADQSRAEAQQAEAVGLGNEASNWANVGSGGSSRFDSPDSDLASMLVADKSLREHILEQLAIATAPTAVRAIAAHLAEYVDDAGYLVIDSEGLAQRLGAELDQVDSAIALIQSLDPAGVGARSLAECLKLQLLDKNRYDPAMEALIENLELLAQAKLSKLMKLCGVGQDDMREMIDEIRDLDPKPGSRFNNDIAQTLIPDAYVKKNALGSWVVELNTDTLPRVLVNTRYAAEVSKGGEKVKTYLNECLQSANWLAKSLDQRARTILKVSTEIVRQQDGFFEYGISELRPLNLKTVADAIGMHESTVSRVTSNKYLATSRGVFELKFFFTAAIAATDGGDSYSAESVRHRIKTLIDAETVDQILSDDKLVKLLNDDGIDIARRTVAKYREAMDIPSSVQRRRKKSQQL